tara:strand:- start:1049 stop:1543 length:495 start_codon:yes stop_codon:yes gene_type:complete
MELEKISVENGETGKRLIHLSFSLARGEEFGVSDTARIEDLMEEFNGSRPPAAAEPEEPKKRRKKKAEAEAEPEAEAEAEPKKRRRKSKPEPEEAGISDAELASACSKAVADLGGDKGARDLVIEIVGDYGVTEVSALGAEVREEFLQQLEAEVLEQLKDEGED